MVAAGLGENGEGEIEIDVVDVVGVGLVAWGAGGGDVRLRYPVAPAGECAREELGEVVAPGGAAVVAALVVDVRRLRAELRRSLEAPHPESRDVAEQGLVAYRDALPVEPTDLVAMAVGVRVAWRDGEGWSAGGEP